LRRLLESQEGAEVARETEAPLGEQGPAAGDDRLLGIPVRVKGVQRTQRDEIVAICTRGRLRQAIPILDLTLPSPAPAGAEWIEAYRRWAGQG